MRADGSRLFPYPAGDFFEDLRRAFRASARRHCGNSCNGGPWKRVAGGGQRRSPSSRMAATARTARLTPSSFTRRDASVTFACTPGDEAARRARWCSRIREQVAGVRAVRFRAEHWGRTPLFLPRAATATASGLSAPGGSSKAQHGTRCATTTARKRTKPLMTTVELPSWPPVERPRPTSP